MVAQLDGRWFRPDRGEKKVAAPEKEMRDKTWTLWLLSYCSHLLYVNLLFVLFLSVSTFLPHLWRQVSLSLCRGGPDSANTKKLDRC
jgi:hypothetical protein